MLPTEFEVSSFSIFFLFWFLSAVLFILLPNILFSALLKELSEVKRKSAALQMQQFVGEEKNDLLDYLRSLQPEKVCISSLNITEHIS